MVVTKGLLHGRGHRNMRERIKKIVFFLLSMVFLFLIYRWALMLKESDSPYVNFENKIETFR